MTRRAEIVSVRNLSLARAIEMTHYRKLQFVDRQGWDLPFYDGGPCERDQFDVPTARYMFFSDDDGDCYSMRLLPAPESMIASIWPDMLPHIDSESLEVSRFVSHDSQVPPHEFPFKSTFWASGYPSIFAVADRAMLAVYARSLKWKPNSRMQFPQYPGINLVQWTQP